MMKTKLNGFKDPIHTHTLMGWIHFLITTMKMLVHCKDIFKLHQEILYLNGMVTIQPSKIY